MKRIANCHLENNIPNSCGLKIILLDDIPILKLNSNTKALQSPCFLDEEPGRDEFNDNITRTKFIRDRIKIVEKYIPELGKALFDYTNKMAKSRDCVDKIALILDDYAKAENVTTAFKLQATDFANILLNVGTKLDAQVHAMEIKVLEELEECEKLCNHVQNELKISVTASDKEKNWVRQLKRIKATQSHDPEQVSLAEAEFIKARGESARSSENLNEQIDFFEKKRLNALRGALLAWTLAELHFHSKALQLFTDAYRVAAEIDVNVNIEEFRNKLRSAGGETPRSDSLRRSDSVFQLISFPTFRRKIKFSGRGIPHPSSAQSSPRSSQLTNSFQDD